MKVYFITEVITTGRVNRQGGNLKHNSITPVLVNKLIIDTMILIMHARLSIRLQNTHR